MPRLDDAGLMTRRALFQRAGMGIGGIALASLLNGESSGAEEALNPLAPKSGHFPPRAKNVIYIHLVGGPSHLDLFDFKPELQKRHGELCPAELFEGKPFAFIDSRPTIFGTPKEKAFEVKQCGASGAPISNLMPHLQGVADELCFLKSIQTDEFNHGPAQLFLLTGSGRLGRPSIGSWATYGLGSENQNLPGYVVMVTGSVLGAGSSAWGSGFLPTVYQGVEFRSQGEPVLYLTNPPGVERESRGRIVETVSKLNRAALADVGDPEIATRIEQYELAYRMQTSVPELMQITDEPEHIHKLYGAEPGKASFANNCLLARRLVERGVRFVQLFDEGWDHHQSLAKLLPQKAKHVDQPIAALISDLKQRGLLDETLVVWSGEFGRTPMAQGRDANRQTVAIGRDHHKDCFTLWMAGGGTRAGISHGASDELGYSPVEKPVHVHDMNATILHLLGIDHEKLTFRYQGRQFRLTDVAGKVVPEILA